MTAELEDLKAMWLDLRAHVDQLVGERQHYLDFFERATEAYLVTDTACTIIEANGAAVDVLQRRRQHLKGKPLTTLVALERRSEFRARVRGLVAREPRAPRTWITVVEAPELRADVTFTARPIERDGAITGICWLLQPTP